MKIMVEQPSIQSATYPCVMQDVGDPDFLVLFSGPGNGTILKTVAIPYQAGYHSETWSMDGFAPFKGIITIDCTE